VSVNVGEGNWPYAVAAARIAIVSRTTASYRTGRRLSLDPGVSSEGSHHPFSEAEPAARRWRDRPGQSPRHFRHTTSLSALECGGVHPEEVRCLPDRHFFQEGQDNRTPGEHVHGQQNFFQVLFGQAREIGRGQTAPFSKITLSRRSDSQSGLTQLAANCSQS